MTPQDARKELARRELARRQSARTQQPSGLPQGLELNSPQGTPQERLQELRAKKRLSELRAKRDGANPFDQFDSERDELNRLRKLKRLRELEAKEAGLPEGFSVRQPAPTTAELAQRVKQPQQPSDIPARGTPEFEARRAELLAQQQQAQGDSRSAQRKIDVLNPVLGGANFLNRAANSLTLGLNDRVVSTALEAKDLVTGADRNRSQELRDLKEGVRQQFPKSSLAADIGGAALGLGKLNAAKALPSQVLSRVGSKLPLAGRLNGFGRSTAATVTDGVGIAATQAAFNGDNVLGAGAQGGAISAATNTLFRGAGAPIANALKNSRLAQAPTTKALREAKNAAFDKVKGFGAEFSPQQLQGLLGRIEKQIPQGGLGGISTATHPTTATALQRLKSNANAPALLDDLQVFRSNLSASPLNKPDKRLAGKIRSELDKFTATQQPARVATGTGKQANDALLSARQQNRVFEQSKALDKIEERIGLSVANKNGRKDEAITASLRGILNSPKKSRQFDKEQLDEMRRIIQGGAFQNAGRNAASFDPTSGGIKGLFTGASLFSPAAPLTGALGGLGLLGRAGINARTTKDFAKLSASIRRGGGPEISPSQLEELLSDPAHSEAAARLISTFAGSQ